MPPDDVCCDEKSHHFRAMRFWYAICSIVNIGTVFPGLALKTFSTPLAVAALLTMMAACGGSRDEAGAGSKAPQLPTAATLGDQVVLPASELLASEPYASADRSRGERQAQFCRACHSLEQGGANMIGPALFGFFGREVGGQSGFEYSAAMRDADFIWTPEAMHAWLAQPGRFLPGNRMTFAGVPAEQDRNDLIAYLLDATTRSKDE
jgi:cytochrome c